MVAIVLSIVMWIVGILLAIPLKILLKKAQVMLTKVDADKVTQDVINFVNRHSPLSKNKEKDRKFLKKVLLALILRFKTTLGSLISILTVLQTLVTTSGVFVMIMLVVVIGMSAAVSGYVTTMDTAQKTSLGKGTGSTLSADSEDTAEVFTGEIDNKWATFIVSPTRPAFTTSEQAKEILNVFANDSSPKVSSAARESLEATGITVDLTSSDFKGGAGLDQFPNGYSDFGGECKTYARGELMSIAESFVKAMISDMQSEIGTEYGVRSTGDGMGYRTFYHAGIGAHTTNGYWSRTLGAFSEHCLGVAQDFTYTLGLDHASGTGAEQSANNPEFAWLANNAHKYGFIWRFKITGEDVSVTNQKTGTIYEDWHWRFVGVYHATKFWEKCSNGEQGYVTNDSYIWEDYWEQNIKGKSDYPQSCYDAITSFYSSDNTKCNYSQYKASLEKKEEPTTTNN